MTTVTAHVFNDGDSQAVEIPAEFQLDTDRVLITRNKQGALVLHPVRETRGTALMAALQALAEVDEAFVQALQADRAAVPPLQQREGR